ncbi:glycosyl hydrolase family 28-related protein [Pseudomonas aeruginosa]
MTTYATGNPLGSKDPRDLYDNAENFDTAMNDRENLAWSDRFGVSRKTWFGLEQQVADYLAAQGYEPVPLEYVDGSPLTVDRPTQLIERDDNLYSVKLPASFPVELTGNWATDQDLLVAQVDRSLRQQLRDSGGSGMVGFNASESYPSDTIGYEVNTLRALKVVVVTNYGATGNGTTDDTAAIQAAIAAAGPYSDVVFPSGTYLITSTLTSLTGQRWLGRGGQRGTTIKKGANIDMVVVGNLSTILDINLEGVGATYTGKGFRIVSGFSQSITRCRAVNMGGNPLWFDVDAGSGANVTCFEGYPVDPDAYAGIQIAGDTGAHPRFFRGIWLGGANFALGPGGGNGGSLSEFYIRTFIFDPTSALFHISNGRCSTPATTLRGFDHSIDGVAFSGTVTLDSAQGINLGPSCGINNNFTEVNSQYNSVYIQRRTYTPTWAQSTATPSIGNGTLTGSFVRSGHMCHLQLELIAGSTTTFGDSASAYRFSLPFPGHLSFNQRGFPVKIYDSSAGTDFTGWASIAAGSSEFTISFGGQQVRASSPMTWANGDTLQCSFSYMVR